MPEKYVSVTMPANSGDSWSNTYEALMKMVVAYGDKGLTARMNAKEDWGEGILGQKLARIQLPERLAVKLFDVLESQPRALPDDLLDVRMQIIKQMDVKKLNFKDP